MDKLFNYWLLFLFSDKKEAENYKQCEAIVRQAGTKLKVYFGASKSVRVTRQKLSISQVDQVSVNAPAKPMLDISHAEQISADTFARQTLKISLPVEQVSVSPSVVAKVDIEISHGETVDSPSGSHPSNQSGSAGAGNIKTTEFACHEQKYSAIKSRTMDYSCRSLEK